MLIRGFLLCAAAATHSGSRALLASLLEIRQRKALAACSIRSMTWLTSTAEESSSRLAQIVYHQICKYRGLHTARTTKLLALVQNAVIQIDIKTCLGDLQATNATSFSLMVDWNWFLETWLQPNTVTAARKSRRRMKIIFNSTIPRVQTDDLSIQTFDSAF